MKIEIEEVIQFIEKWRDRQVCIGRRVVNLIANEIIDSISQEYLRSRNENSNSK